MNESIKGLKRTHKVAEICEDDIGKEVTIMGWVNNKRVFAGQVFLIVRDISGIAQIVFDTENTNEEIFNKTNDLKAEYVVAVRGIVNKRTPNNYNTDMKTGTVEIIPSEFRILSTSDSLPFTNADKGVKENLRMKYRYLDLRRKELQHNFILRHKIAQSTREFLSNEGFLEIETPFLMKSTPEGARDYLVPSRIYPGNFYALPQSPQMFKQLLMVSGFDRYFQIVKCFRDEDLRSDRQPEFTQIDIELSFVDVEDVIDVNERLIQKIFKDTLNVDLLLPFQRMKYVEAMERFGSDKPDLRYSMELKNISNVVDGSDFAVFQNPIDTGGSVRAINAKGCNNYSRKQLDSLTTMAKSYGAKGLAWIGLNDDGTYKTTISKFFSDDKLKEIADTMEAEKGDIILICADKNNTVFNSLGAIRVEIAKREELADPNKFNFVWITEFPLFQWDDEDERFYAVHHLFTSPMDEDFHLLDSDPKNVRSKAYDLALNGYELGGGSIRISNREVQEKIIAKLGISNEEMNDRFGFLLDAFKFGTPPHGGLAFGLDRITMLIAGTNDIRDVIAFPKTKDATCLMSDAPNIVDAEQLDELGISFKKIIDRNKKNDDTKE